VAAAPANGIGILGVWPGARALNVPLKTVPGTEGDISCDASAQAIAQAVQAGAAVINMSYGSTQECTTEKIQIYYALARGAIPVAAAGNEFQQGNPLEFPASLPHVVTVAATDADGRSAAFSNANDAVDLAAPGVGILTAVPPALDDDGTPDGYEALSGTSFAAPMVSAAMAWLRQARPDLQPDQAVQAVRLSAHDVGRKGWDALTGFGVLDVGAALRVAKDKLPIHDPLEPNDNLVWVDGRAFGGKPADAIWSGGRATRVNALLDREEDPSDVYRVLVGAGRSARISAIPRFGDVQLSVFRSSAVSINDTRGRAARSHLRGSKKTERVTIVNRGKRAHSYYVEVSPQGTSAYQDRAYTLRVG
jgi:subtilisin family serine protease